MTPELPDMLCIILISILSGLTGIPAVDFEIQPADVTKVCVQGSTGTTGSRCSLQFQCQVNSTASEQAVSWIKNGVIISDGDTFRSTANHLIDRDRYILIEISAGNLALLVNSVSLSTAEFDSGTYQCAVTGSNGIIVPDGRSRTAHANIYVLDSTTPTSTLICRLRDSTGQNIPQTNNALVRSDDSYTLTCLAQVSNPQAQLIWHQNYPNGMIETPVNGTQNGFIYSKYYWIPTSSDGSTLLYTCVLKQPGLSQTQACSINFNIQYAPIVTIDPTDVMVTEENDEVVLHCTQDANRQVAESVWYYDDDVVNLVNGSSRFIVEEMSLRILNLHPRDNGVHLVTCKATNEEGTGNASASITVSIPLPTTEPSTQSSSTTMSTIGSSQGHRPTTPKEGLNIIAVVGGIVGAVLLILIGALVILVCFKIRKKLTPSQTQHDAGVTAKSNECDFDMINDVHAAHSSQAYATVNGAFDDDAPSTEIDVSAEFNNREKKEFQVDASADCTEDLYSKPKKKNKQGSNRAGRADNKQKTDTHTDNVPPPVPGKNFSENTQGSEAEDGQYANMRPKADKYQKLKKNSTPAEESAYPNVQHPVNKQTDSFYEEIPSPGRKGYSKSHRSNAEGQLEEVKVDAKVALKNVEGLTYAELDLSRAAPTHMRSRVDSHDSDIVYAELKI